MLKVLPLETILRTLGVLREPPGQASEYRPGTDSPASRVERPWLSPCIVAALERAYRDGLREFTDTDDKVQVAGKEVGPLTFDEFRALAAWCRSVGLSNDAEVIEHVLR